MVNNDFDTMSLLKMWLEKKDYKVKYTGSASEADQLVHEFKPNLVIVDILQKDVAEKLKTEVKTREVPVLIMTGYTKRDPSIDVKCNDVIEKPFDLHQLEKKIEKLVS